MTSVSDPVSNFSPRATRSPQTGVIVNFPIEYNRQVPPVHRLIASWAGIDDRQSPVSQAHSLPVIQPQSGVVRPPGSHLIIDSAKVIKINRTSRWTVVEQTGYPAHEFLQPVQVLPEPIDGLSQPCIQRHRRLPSQLLLGFADIRTALLWVILGQWQVLDI